MNALKKFFLFSMVLASVSSAACSSGDGVTLCADGQVTFVSIDARDGSMGNLAAYINNATYLIAYGDHPAKALWLSMLMYAQKESKNVQIHYVKDANANLVIKNVVVLKL